MGDYEQDYAEFEQRMHRDMPEMFSKPYGGFAIGRGWWPIVETLCRQIYAYTKWQNNTRQDRLAKNPHNLVVPDYVEPIQIEQIKEKFGGLRFYYQGGDKFVEGLVTMAELWCGRTCEDCGAPGTRRSGGWVRTLCEQHELEYKRQRAAYATST